MNWKLLVIFFTILISFLIFRDSINDLFRDKEIGKKCGGMALDHYYCKPGYSCVNAYGQIGYSSLSGKCVKGAAVN